MPFTLRLLLVAAYSALLTVAQEQTCYWRSNGATGVTDDSWFACNNTQQISGGAQLCCLQDSECGTDALCHQPSSGGGSGWFVGGCTDPTYDDPVCRTSCTNDAQTWIQYNYTSQLWHCCGDDACTGTPTSETFQAAPPEQFSPVPSGPQSASSSASSTSSSTASTTPPAPSGMSTGAKAGIGVVAAVAGIAIAAAIAFFVLWRKAKRVATPAQRPEDRWQQEQGMQQHQQQPQQHVYAHYGSQPANYYPKPPEEMASNVQTSELAGEEMGNARK